RIPSPRAREPRTREPRNPRVSVLEPAKPDLPDPRFRAPGRDAQRLRRFDLDADADLVAFDVLLDDVLPVEPAVDLLRRDPDPDVVPLLQLEIDRLRSGVLGGIDAVDARQPDN